MTEDSNENAENAETPEEFDRKVRAAVGLDAPGSGSGRVDPPPNVEWIDAYYPRDAVLPEQPPAFGLNCTPAAVTTAWDLMAEEAERANLLRDEIAEYGSKVASAEADYLNAVRRAEAENTAPPKPRKPADAAEMRALKARHQVRAEAFRTARRQFETALKAERPAWLAAILAEVQPAHDAAVKAMPQLVAASQAFTTWWALRKASENFYFDLNPTRHGPERLKVDPRALSTAIAQASAILTSDEPGITGAWMTDKLDPPRHVREQMARGTDVDRQAILFIEAREEWKITQFSKGYAVRYGVLPLSKRPDGVQFAPA